jgi:hypothetical protein
MKLLLTIIAFIFLICGASFAKSIVCSIHGEEIFHMDAYHLTASLTWNDSPIEMKCYNDHATWLCDDGSRGDITYSVEVTQTSPPQAKLKISRAMRRDSSFDLLCSYN